MMEIVQFIIALLLGALVGLQREYEQHITHLKMFAGIRTFMFISLLGSLVGFMSQEVFQSNWFAIIGFMGIFLFAALSYTFSYIKYHRNTATTEITSVIMFIVGLLCVMDQIKLAVMIGIITMALLAFKKKLHGVAEHLKKSELTAIVEFALIALVVLPLLPNKNYSPLDVPLLSDLLIATGISESVLSQLNVFNLYHMWLMVILVAGISFFGYMLVRFFGSNRGYWFTGLLGGIASSTAVTIAMAQESKKNKFISKPFVTAVVVATATSFIRILFIVAAVNKMLISSLIVPLGAMSLFGLGVAGFLWKNTKNKQSGVRFEVTQPFALKPALTFGFVFMIIKFFAKLLQVLFGSSGVYIASFLAGLGDVDAIALTMSSLSQLGDISVALAVSAIVLATSANTLVKVGISWWAGERKFARYVSYILVATLAVGLAIILA
jgi:uncharacterized membrane protein (DUF4010 family)